MLKPSRLKRFWLSVGALVAFCCVKRAFRGPDVLKPFRLKRFTCPDTFAK